MKNKQKNKQGVTILPKISHNCDTLGWKFAVYVSPTGSQSVQKEIDGLNPVVYATFAVSLRYLANKPQRLWARPQVAKLRDVDDIYEIRFQANKVQYRPMGFFGPEEGVFTILIWVSKKGKIYEPTNAIKSAENRGKEILTHRARYMPLKINGEELPLP